MGAAYIHDLADVHSVAVGEGTTIWQYSVVLERARIGARVNICSHCFIENDVIIGDDVTIKNAVQLWDGLRIEDGVFIGPGVSFTNDPFPRSKAHLADFPQTTVKRGASIGANATILPGLTIGERAMVGAGAVVTKSVPDYAIVVGNPATITGYVNSRPDPIAHASRAAGISTEGTKIPGVNIHNFPVMDDIRGKLTVGEFERDIPFRPKRYFMVFDVPSRETRGEHAHRECHQFLICIRGSCVAVADDGKVREEIRLDRCNRGLHLPPMVWGTQFQYSSDAILLVFASHHYDPDDYIRDYTEFLHESGLGEKSS